MADSDLPIREAALAQVCDVINVTASGAGTFEADSVPHFNDRIYGGQVLAQALTAAARTVAPDRFAHSLHGYFLRPGQVGLPIELSVEVLHDGRSFSARRTHALQDGVPILSMIASFQEVQEGLDHQDSAPTDLPAPEDLPSSDAVYFAAPPAARPYLAPKTAFDVRHVQGTLFRPPGQPQEPRQELWLRAQGEVPADRNTRAALLAYVCDGLMLEPALRGHGLSWLSPGLSVASIDHAMWWYRDVDLSDWLLFVQTSPASHGGRAHGAARVYDRSGRLVASIAQEGVLRTQRNP